MDAVNGMTRSETVDQGWHQESLAESPTFHRLVKDSHGLRRFTGCIIPASSCRLMLNYLWCVTPDEECNCLFDQYLSLVRSSEAVSRQQACAVRREEG